ncbi:MAG: hypothetical protein RSA20_11030, partial [Oscillospiraceae bacterium]
MNTSNINATGGEGAAGIGGGSKAEGSHLFLQRSAKVTTTGGKGGAGIGGGTGANGVDIRIINSEITATGGEGAAGIGGGLMGNGIKLKGYMEVNYDNGVKVTANGGAANPTTNAFGGSGIGGGGGGTGSDIQFYARDSRTSLTAIGGDYSPGIGGSAGGTDIILSFKDVYAQGGRYAAGIGGGHGGSGKRINVRYGNVFAYGQGGAGIGGGLSGDGEEISIEESLVTAADLGYFKDGELVSFGGAGIGGGENGKGNNIKITGPGEVTATGSA